MRLQQMGEPFGFRASASGPGLPVEDFSLLQNCCVNEAMLLAHLAARA